MYSGRQWLFTPGGLEAAKPLAAFAVPAGKFTELTERDGVTVYAPPIEVAETTAFDIEEFILAYTEALSRYEGAYAPQADQAILNRTIEEARRIRVRAA